MSSVYGAVGVGFRTVQCWMEMDSLAPLGWDDAWFNLEIVKNQTNKSLPNQRPSVSSDRLSRRQAEEME